jgi:hypothetical protein
MRWFLYRWAIRLKDFGEQAGHKRRWYADLFIAAGLALKERL